MSKIDLNNPKVLGNYLRTLVKEGKGKFKTKEKVLVMELDRGGEIVVPDDIREEFEEAKKEVAKETPKVPKETPKKEEKK